MKIGLTQFRFRDNTAWTVEYCLFLSFHFFLVLNYGSHIKSQSSENIRLKKNYTGVNKNTFVKFPEKSHWKETRVSFFWSVPIGGSIYFVKKLQFFVDK